jgi:hypothetical protein
MYCISNTYLKHTHTACLEKPQNHPFLKISLVVIRHHLRHYASWLPTCCITTKMMLFKHQKILPVYIYIYTHPADDYSFLCPRIYIHTPPTYTLLECTSNYLCLQEETTNAYTRNCSRLSETLEDNQILVHFGFRANTSPTLSLEVNHILVHFGLVRN